MSCNFFSAKPQKLQGDVLREFIKESGVLKICKFFVNGNKKCISSMMSEFEMTSKLTNLFSNRCGCSLKANY